MLTLTKEVMYIESIDPTGRYFLAGDIGGTNSNFGIFSLKAETPLLVASVHFKSQDIGVFTEFFKSVVDYIHERYSITFEAACIGAAGVVYPHRVYAHPTNLPIEINANELIKVTGIKVIFLINDFEAVALGVELVAPKDIIVINRGVHREHGNIGFVGAGTGLGKGIMVWHRDSRRYFPVSSEGGHADASFYDASEFALAEFIFQDHQAFPFQPGPVQTRSVEAQPQAGPQVGLVGPVSWEDVLSGAGIQIIYRFLGTQKKYPTTAATLEIEKHNFNPDRISFYAQEDSRCKDTFDIYVKFYARCAKNFALDCLALNGMYIAGGIAAKNISMFFDPLFLQEFVRCRKEGTLLATIPVLIIADYNVSLYGAVAAYRLRELGLL